MARRKRSAMRWASASPVLREEHGKFFAADAAKQVLFAQPARQAEAMAWSTRSPTGWPQVSLMRLNQSTSNTASESGVNKALLRASSCAVVSWKKRRFAAPVRASVLARFFSSSCRLCSSVMSLLKPIKPASPLNTMGILIDQ